DARRDLSRDVADHPATAAWVADGLAKIEALEAPAAVDGWVAPAGSPYAGADACAGCHEAEHAQWRGTPHANAWATLERERRAMDADCYACHATGVGADGGPTRPAAVGGLRDVQCEACHGPSRAHAARPA